MTNLSPIEAGAVGRVTPNDQPSQRVDERRPGKPRRGDDRVEVSEAARYLARMNAMPEIRTDLVDRVKNEIKNGTYDTPERFNLAVDAMIDDLS
ncbi:MAG: flagellar biosynthesis anti-sigma factor FlgM [Phycisphaeraceae bacterium]|nr:MAG: flagellar biosynthesis anti-sigma factor FlgM [Phycisphaeraceae bacterium]